MASGMLCSRKLGSSNSSQHPVERIVGLVIERFGEARVRVGRLSLIQDPGLRPDRRPRPGPSLRPQERSLTASGGRATIRHWKNRKCRRQEEPARGRARRRRIRSSLHAREEEFSPRRVSLLDFLATGGGRLLYFLIEGIGRPFVQGRPTRSASWNNLFIPSPVSSRSWAWISPNCPAAISYSFR